MTSPEEVALRILGELQGHRDRPQRVHTPPAGGPRECRDCGAGYDPSAEGNPLKCGRCLEVSGNPRHPEREAWRKRVAARVAGPR